MATARRLGITFGALVLLSACQPRESVEVARARLSETLLVKQIADLQALVQRAESGDLVTTDRIAIGIAEGVAQELLNASLPQEKAVGDRVVVRIEKAVALFRGNNAALLFQARARGTGGRVTAGLELGGRLANVRIENGRLVASVEMEHFKVLDTSLGDMTADALEGLVRGHLDELAGVLPPLEIPVHLEQSIRIPGLEAGIVMAKGGALSLEITVAETIPVNERLWILLDAKAGPWTPAAGGRDTR